MNHLRLQRFHRPHHQSRTKTQKQVETGTSVDCSAMTTGRENKREDVSNKKTRQWQEKPCRQRHGSTCLDPKADGSQGIVSDLTSVIEKTPLSRYQAIFLSFISFNGFITLLLGFSSTISLHNVFKATKRSLFSTLRGSSVRGIITHQYNST
jgi:hypothetical protein